MLRVNHPMMQLQVLKLIKSQMPWCGRKWRQSRSSCKRTPVDMRMLTVQANMKVITSIYLNCRPELRDEWLAGTDQDTELEDALVRFSEFAPRSTLTAIAARVRFACPDSVLQQAQLPRHPTRPYFARTSTSPYRVNFGRHARRSSITQSQSPQLICGLRRLPTPFLD
jgi:hypothetical protein